MWRSRHCRLRDPRRQPRTPSPGPASAPHAGCPPVGLCRPSRPSRSAPGVAQLVSCAGNVERRGLEDKHAAGLKPRAYAQHTLAAANNRNDQLPARQARASRARASGSLLDHTMVARVCCQASLQSPAALAVTSRSAMSSRWRSAIHNSTGTLRPQAPGPVPPAPTPITAPPRACSWRRPALRR
jgi:hypothetical protein